MQQAYDVFVKNEDVIKAFDQVYISLTELDLGKLILSKGTYCKCANVQMRQVSAPHCMLYFHFHRCSSISLTPDGRLTCSNHRVGSEQSKDRRIPSALLVSYPLQADKKFLLLSVRGEMMAVMKSDWIVGNSLRDAHDGIRPSLPRRSAASESCEAFFPFSMRTDSFIIIINSALAPLPYSRTIREVCKFHVTYAVHMNLLSV